MIKKLFKAVFIITLFSVITRVLGFILKIYLSRTIGAEALGILQISMSICMVFITIVSSGIPLIVSKKVAEFKTLNKKNDTDIIVTTAIIIGLIIALVCSLLIIICNRLIGMVINPTSVIILIYLTPAIIASSITAGINGKLWGEQKHLLNCSIEFFEQVFRLILCVAFISSAKDFITGAIRASIALSVSCVLAMIFALILYFKKGGKLRFNKKFYRPLIKTSVPITAVRFIGSLTQPIISIIMPLRLLAIGLTSEQALSQFGIISGMTLPLIYVPITIIGSLSTALIPDLSSLYAEKRFDECKSKITSALLFTIFTAGIFIPTFMAVGVPASVFLFNNSSCGVFLIQSAWIMLPLSLSSITASILNVLNLEVKSFINYVVGSVGLLFSIIFLPKYVQITSLTIGLGICMSIVSVLNLKMIYKNTKLKPFVLKPIFQMAVVCIPTYYITKFCYNILSSLFYEFFCLALSCIVGVLFFIVLCSIFNLFNLKNLYIDFKEKFKTKFKMKTLKYK